MKVILSTITSFTPCYPSVRYTSACLLTKCTVLISSRKLHLFYFGLNVKHHSDSDSVTFLIPASC